MLNTVEPTGYYDDPRMTVHELRESYYANLSLPELVQLCLDMERKLGEMQDKEWEKDELISSMRRVLRSTL